MATTEIDIGEVLAVVGELEVQRRVLVKRVTELEGMAARAGDQPSRCPFCDWWYPPGERHVCSSGPDGTPAVLQSRGQPAGPAVPA